MSDRTIIKDTKLSPKEEDEFFGEFAFDLVSFFKLIEEDIIETIDNNQHKTPEDIIHEIIKVINDGGV